MICVVMILSMNMYVYDDHAGDNKTVRSHYGFMILMSNDLTHWFKIISKPLKCLCLELSLWQ